MVGNTQDKFTSALIKKWLRQAWLRSKHRSEAIKKGRVGRGLYLCRGCGCICRPKEFHVDHIIPVKPFVSWQVHIERLFCGTDNLQLLCHSCHKQKTKAEQLLAN